MAWFTTAAITLGAIALLLAIAFGVALSRVMWREGSAVDPENVDFGRLPAPEPPAGRQGTRLYRVLVASIFPLFYVPAVAQTTQTFGPNGRLFHVGEEDHQIQKAYLMSQREWGADMIAEGGQVRLDVYRIGDERPSDIRLLNYEAWCDSYTFDDDGHWGGGVWAKINNLDGTTYKEMEDHGTYTYRAVGNDVMRQHHLPSTAVPPSDQWFVYNLWWAVCGQVATANNYNNYKWSGGRPTFQKYTSAVAAPSTPVGRSAIAPADGATEVDEVALVQKGHLFEIPVRINGVITLNFIIDSGASDVQIPFDVFSTLIRANTIEKSDIKGEETYVLADGSKQQAIRFVIREITIGRHTVHDVPGSVGTSTGSLLLGQSFLSHFGSWTLDNTKHVLKLVGKSSAQQ